MATMIDRLVVALVLFAVPLAVEAQQAALPTVGFFRSTPSALYMNLVTAFRQGLIEEGFIEGQNMTIEYRWADNHLDRLPGLAAELVGRQVAVIVGNSVAAQAAKVSRPVRESMVSLRGDEGRGSVRAAEGGGGQCSARGGGEWAARDRGPRGGPVGRWSP
jgi:hypothetical protein